MAIVRQTSARPAARRPAAGFDVIDLLVRIGFWPLLALAGVLTLIPVYLMVKVSVSAPPDLLTQHPPFWFHHVTLAHWERVLASGDLWAPLFKSLWVASGTTVLAVAIAAPAAYVIAQLPRKIRYSVILGLLFTRMFPDVMIALPIAVTFIRWNLLDTSFGLMLAHLIPNLPFLAWILVGTFETVPRALEEAATVDGTSRLGALVRVVFPAAAPGIMVGALFVWLNSWNEFTYATYLTTANRTLPLMTFFFQQRGSWFDSASFAVILTIPVVAITYLLQKYLVSGALSGAVKG